MTRRTSRLRLDLLEDRTTPSAGDLDPAFGSGGQALVPVGASSSTRAVAVQPDGKVVLAGARDGPSGPGTGSADMAVVRLLPDGRPDPTFGVGGTVVIPLDVNDPADGNFANNDEAAAVAVQPDGRIVLAGQAGGYLAAVRLMPDGTFDPAFGAGGKVVVPRNPGSPASASGVAIQPDGRIVLGGTVLAEATAGAPASRAPDYTAVRLMPDGSLDPSFGTGGKATVGFARGFCLDVALQSDGAIVLVGREGQGIGAARLLSDGSPDPSFGAGGKAVFATPGWTEQATDVEALPDGRLVLAAAQFRTIRVGVVETNAVVTRLTAGGSLDPVFGIGGRVVLGREGGQRADSAALNPTLAAAAQPDGMILVAGSAFDATAFTVARLTPDGALDPLFGSGGRVAGPDGGIEFVADLAVGPGGTIALTGPTPLPSRFAAARLVGGAGTPTAQPALAGGSPDGTAVPLVPSGGGYQLGQPVQFFPGFAGEVRTATADVTGDGVPDHVGGAGPGGGPRVAVIDGRTGARVSDFFAFEAAFTGGVFVAAGDVDGDGQAEVVVTPDRGGGPVVAVYSGARLAAGAGGEAAQLVRFLGIDDGDFRGGARAAVGDVTGDGLWDLVVAAGFGGGPRVAAFDGLAVAAGSTNPARLLPDFFAFEDSLRNGAFVAAGDVDVDGFADLAFGGGPNGGPRVRVFGGHRLLISGGFGTLDAVVGQAQLADFFAADSSSRGGVPVALRDADGDGRADLVAGSGAGEPSRVRVFRSGTLLGGPTAPGQDLDPFAGVVLPNGAFVG